MDRFAIACLVIFANFGMVLAGGPVVAPKPAGEPCPECRLRIPPPWAERHEGPELPPSADVRALEPIPLERHSPGTPDAQDVSMMPRPLPPQENVIPIEPSRPDGATRALVEKYLSDLSESEQRIWVEELRGLPSEVARELLLSRERAGGGKAFDAFETFDATPPPVQSEPPLPDESPVISAPRPESDRVASLERSVKLLQQAERLILDNIANAETVGYKRTTPLTAGASKLGITALTPRRIETQGPLIETGRPLDLAIEGKGLFQIVRKGTIGVTRRGMFRVSDQGTLVAQVADQDWEVYPRIEVPRRANDLSVGSDGEISCRISPGGPPKIIGRIELAKANDVAGLQAIAAGVWAMPDGIVPVRSGTAPVEGLGTIRSGYLEGSNVQLDEEFQALKRLRRQIEALREALAGS